MRVEVDILFGNKVKRLLLESTYIKSELLFLKIKDFGLKCLDNITNISITSKRIIIVNTDPEFRISGLQTVPFEKDSCMVSNINAYDWNGNHLWNIADIVGDIKRLFLGGCMITKDTFENAPWAEYSVDLSKVSAEHEFYNACTDGRRYIIDLETLEVIMILPNK